SYRLAPGSVNLGRESCRPWTTGSHPKESALVLAISKARSVIAVMPQHARHRPEPVEGRLKGTAGGRVVRQAHHGGSTTRHSTKVGTRLALGPWAMRGGGLDDAHIGR